MEEDILTNTLQHHESQILGMRREMNGLHASITEVETRVNRGRLWMIMVGIIFVVVAVWLWLN